MRKNILLSFSFSKRDFKERYVGTSLGHFWYLLSPVITIFIYTVIFSDFMKMKMDIVDSSYGYSIYLVPGLLAWTSFSTILGRLNSSFFDKAGLIKKINIPMFTFQLSIVITEFFIFVIAMLLGFGFLLLVDHPVSFVFLWVLPVMFLQTLFAFGVGVVFSLFTPFFRDMKELVPVVLQLWFWTTPIIYLKSMIYDKYPFIVDYNPFFYFVQIYQDIFLYSKAPEIETIVTIFIMTVISVVVAGYLYKKMIGSIKDII